MDRELQETVLRITSLLAQHQYSEAVSTCRRVLTLNPTSLEVRFLLGSALVQLDRTKEARAELQVILSHKPSDAPAFRVMGESYLREGAYDRAANALREAVRLDPHDPFAVGFLNEAEAQLGEDPPTSVRPVASLSEKPATFITPSAPPLKSSAPPPPQINSEESAQTRVSWPARPRRERADSEPITFGDIAREPIRMTVNKIEPVLRFGPNAFRGPLGKIRKIKNYFTARLSTPSPMGRSDIPDRLESAKTEPGVRRTKKRLLVSGVAVVLAAFVVTFFSVRKFLASKRDQTFKTAIERYTNDGCATSLKNAISYGHNHSRSASDRIAYARLLAIGCAEQDASYCIQSRAILEGLARDEAELPEAKLANAWLDYLYGDTENIKKILKEVDTDVETLSEVHHLLALVKMREHHLEEALSDAQRAYSLFPTSVRHAALLARITAQAESVEKAVKILDRTESNSRLPTASVTRARILQESGGDPVRANQDASLVLTDLSALATNRDQSIAHIVLARHSAHLADWPSALQESRSALQLPYAPDEETSLALADLFLQGGSLSEARKAIERITAIKEVTSERSIIETELALRSGDIELAAKALPSLGDSARADLTRGRYWETKGDLAHAKRFYESASRDPRLWASAKVRLASVELGRTQPRDAFKILEEVRKRVPANFEGIAMYVQAALQLGKMKSADDAVLEIKRLQPESPEVLAAQAILYTYKSHFDLAYDAAQHAVRKRPNDPSMQALFGHSAIRLGRLEEAKLAFELALKHAPSFGPALVGMALIALQMGDSALAKQELEKAQKVGSLGLDGARARGFLVVLSAEGEAGVPIVKGLIESFNDPDLYSQLGDLKLQAEAPQDAAAAFARALSLDQSHPEALLGKATIEARGGNAGAVTKTLNLLERVMRERHLGRLFESRVDAVKARARYESNDDGGTTRFAKDALLKHHDNADAHLLLGVLTQERGQDPAPEFRAAVSGILPSAEAFARLALRLGPNNEESCPLAKRYVSMAPKGFDAKAMKKIADKCAQAH